MPLERIQKSVTLYINKYIFRIYLCIYTNIHDWNVKSLKVSLIFVVLSVSILPQLWKHCFEQSPRLASCFKQINNSKNLFHFISAFQMKKSRSKTQERNHEDIFAKRAKVVNIFICEYWQSKVPTLNIRCHLYGTEYAAFHLKFIFLKRR